MKCITRITTLILIAYAIISLSSVTVHADVVGNTDSYSTPPAGVPSSIKINKPASTGCACTPLQQYQTYVPKVTELRSLNAMLAKNGNQVYFVPTLDEFPIDLANSVLTLKDGDGKDHNFAIVCGEYFDTDVTYVRASTNEPYVSRLQTSKLVFSKEDSSRCLNLLGYDLLLSEESANITNTNGVVECDYYVSKVGTSKLTAKTAIMDLYKAVGQYDWDIQVTYVKPVPGWKLEESHILNHITFQTSGSRGTLGVDSSEEQTYVFATRTNPDLYWDRSRKDAIFGGAHNATSSSYVGSETSVSKSFAQNEVITLGEFCTLARAIMTLYGEPVLTEKEKELALNAYGITVPKNSLSSVEEYDSVMYLTAKGIIDPTDIDFNTSITFATIEPILLRIADKDSRLTIKDTNLTNGVLNNIGYREAKISLADEMQVEIYDQGTANWIDYLIECGPNTQFLVRPQDKSETSVYLSNDANGQIATVGTNQIKLQQSTGQYNDAMVSAQGIGLEDVINDPSQFIYDGIEIYDNKSYYHFKLNQNSSIYNNPAIRITYTPQYFNGSREELLTSDSFSINNSEIGRRGGVYKIENGTFVHNTFAEVGFSEQFTDEEVLNLRGSNAIRTADNVIVAVTVPSYFLTKDKLSNVNEEGYDFTNLLDDNGRLIDTTNRTVVISADKGIYASIFPNASNNNDTVRIEFSCIKKQDITDTKFFRQLQDVSYNKNSTIAHTGFYRARDNSLLISYNYLKQLGIVSGITALDNEQGYVITLSKYKSNVILFTKENQNYVMVGDTIYGNITNETLVEMTNGDYLINYRAIIGWASNVVYVNSGKDYITVTRMSSIGSSYNVSYNKKEINELYPHSTIDCTWFNQKVTYGGTINEGFSMSTSFPLAPYVIVAANDNNTDYLFVWHRNGIKVDGSVLNSPDDSEALSKFSQLTGFNLEKQANYTLCMYPLNRSNNGNPQGFKFVNISTTVNSGDKQNVMVGWIYEPPEYNDLTKAVKDYAKSINGTELVIPIVEYKGQYYDVNINTCTSAEGSEQLEIGTLPYRYMRQCSSSNDRFDKVGVMQGDATIDTTQSVGDVSIDNFIIYTAPVASFANFKCLGQKDVKDIKAGKIYFGTSVATVKNNEVLISGSKTSFSTNDKAVCTYLGVTTSTVYAVAKDYSGIGAIVDRLDSTVEEIYNDPAIIVDWGRYKFSRLVKNIDAWSTIVMIFALNILPRVAILIFFILMLLSLIKNVKPWRVFCQRYFDVYSFLTLGHQNVDTVDTKRLFITSFICTCIFIVIMDGQLFNFILFVAKFLVALYQR